MIQVKAFLSADCDEFNAFIKTVRLAGESPIKYNETHVFVFYDTDEELTKVEKLKVLYGNLKTRQHNILECRKEIAISKMENQVIISDPTTKEYDTQKLVKQKNDLVAAKEKMIALEQAAIDGIRTLIVEIEGE